MCSLVGKQLAKHARVGAIGIELYSKPHCFYLADKLRQLWLHGGLAAADCHTIKQPLAGFEKRQHLVRWYATSILFG